MYESEISFQILNSVGSECNVLKHAYDACFNNWFSEKFLKGDNDASPCANLLTRYTACVKVSCLAQNLVCIFAITIPRENTHNHTNGVVKCIYLVFGNVLFSIVCALNTFVEKCNKIRNAYKHITGSYERTKHSD